MLRLEHITAGYNKNPVIKDIDIEFESGKITALIGPNGSGKSTLLKAAVDLCEIYEGAVYLDGKERNVLGNKEFAKYVSYLPQSHSGGSIAVERMVLHGRFPYLSYPRKYGKKDYEYCCHAIEKTGISELKGKKLDELSGGQKQKVYIAMALAGEAQVFLFDEPTTYLDVGYQLELLDIMVQLREQGKTVIVVLHDIDYAMGIADKLAVMEQGKLLLSDTPVNVYESDVISRVFQVKAKKLSDEEGKMHFYFERIKKG